MEYVEAAKLVGNHARAFGVDLYPLVIEVVASFTDLLVSLSRLVVVLLRPLVAVAFALRRALAPSCRVAAAFAWDVFTSQTPEALALEAAAGAMVVVCALLEAKFGVLRAAWRAVDSSFRAVGTSYSRLRRSVREQSRLAAAAMSHLIFLIPVGLSLAWFGSSIHPLVQKWWLVPLSCVAPAAHTCAALYKLDRDSPVQPDDTSMDEMTPMARLHNQSERGPSSPSDSPVSDGSPGVRRLASSTSLEEDRLTPKSTETTSPQSQATDYETSHQTSFASRAFGEGTSSAHLRRRKTSTPQSGTSSAFHRSMSGNETPVTTARAALRETLARESDLLQYWSLFGISWAGRALFWFYAPAFLSPVLLRLDTFIFFFSIWLQSGLTRGARILFPVLASALRQGHHLRANAAAGADQLNIILRMLVSVGFVQPSRAALVSSSLSESGVVLVGAPFFLTPRPATFAATILTGYAVPVYHSAYAATPVALPTSRQTWLSYWVIYMLIELTYMYVFEKLDWLPLLYHGKLLVILWLQLPYFRGASRLLDWAMLRLGRLASRFSSNEVSSRKRRQD